MWQPCEADAEERELRSGIPETLNHYLASKGSRFPTDTVVDATILATLSSVKNSQKSAIPLPFFRRNYQVF